MEQFEEEAQELLSEIECQGLELEVIREFLVEFADRIHKAILVQSAIESRLVKQQVRKEDKSESQS